MLTDLTGDVPVHLVLTDVGEHRAESTKDTTKTAIGHFNRYLVYQKSPADSIDDLESDDITQEIIGKFSDYLKKVVGVAQKSNWGYVSSLRTYIQRKHPNNTAIRDTLWYTTTRQNIKKMYLVTKADEEEKNVFSETSKKKDHMGTSMPERHHSYIGHILFSKADRLSLTDRCLFALNWPCIGKYHGIMCVNVSCHD
jgi:hypothetical protein